MFGQEVVAIFGPLLSQATTNHIRSTSKALSVPHIETGFEYLWERPEFSVNVSPHPWAVGTVSKVKGVTKHNITNDIPIQNANSENLTFIQSFRLQAIANLIRTLGWKEFVIVYENEESLVRLQEVAKLPAGFETADVQISFRQLYTDSTDYRPLLKQIKEEGLMRIVLDCSFEKIETVLLQANEVGIVTDYHSYIINSLVSITIRINISVYFD